MFDHAIERARELDSYFNKHNTTLGPLHGLPISLKDQFYVQGVDTTMGYIGWIDTYEGDTDPNKVHKIESQIVTELLSLGAVMYCKASLWEAWVLNPTNFVIIDQSPADTAGVHFLFLTRIYSIIC